jgi:hypothetical protein
LGFAVSGAGLLVFSESIAFSLIEFLLDRVAVVRVISGREKHQGKSFGDHTREAKFDYGLRTIGGFGSFFIYPTKPPAVAAREGGLLPLTNAI